MRGSLVLLAAFMPMFAPAESVLDKRGFDGRLFYLGGGVGVSLLVPKTGESTYRVADKYDSAYLLNAGIGLGRHWHLDFSHAELGAARLTSPVFPSVDVKYDFKGLSGLYYLRGYDPSLPSRGWDLYAFAGLARLDASAPVAVNVRSDNQLFFGAGVEHRFRRGWGLRLQATTFDEDASVMTLGLVKRFGSALRADHGDDDAAPRSRDDSGVQSATPAESGTSDRTEAMAASPVPVATQAMPAEVDSDADGVPDEQDLCPDSAAGASVDRSGCEDLAASLDNILFEPNAADLTSDGMTAVAVIAEVLNRYPGRSVQVSAHTDSVGSDSYNQALSERRAASVLQALVAEGVDRQRLSSQGKGEREPVASNDTAEGRARNRRVELRFSGN